MATSTPPAVATESAAGSHVLTVNSYGKTSLARLGFLGVGDCFESSRFLVGGHSWYIECYPCGEDEEHADWVGAYLCLDDHGVAGEVEVKASFHITLLAGHAGGVVSSRRFDDETFSSTGEFAWGNGNFIQCKELESSLIKHRHDGGGGGGCFRVRCDVTVHKRETSTAEQPPPDLLRIGDVTFDVGGELLTAHRCVVLAAGSPVSTETVVRIHDMEPRVFKVLLHFVHTGALPAEEGHGGGDKVAMAQALLVAADRYKVEGLKPICTDVLRGSIDATTAVTTLQTAHEHGWHEVEKECIAFLKGVLAKVGQL